MIKDRPVNRRDLISTIAGGTILGGLWGAAFPALSRENRPTISIVGHRHAQIALIDASSARALILIGEPDNQLLDQLPALMTLFRQRIDLLIGSDAALTSSSNIRDRWLIDQAIVIQATTSAPNLSMPTLTLAEPVSIDLDGNVTLMCRPGHRDEWLKTSPPRTSPIWSIELRHSGPSIVFAPDIHSLISTDISSATMVVTPDAPSRTAFQRTPASGWAVNYDTEEAGIETLAGRAITRIYPEDISRFVLDSTGVESPPWTQLPG